tara:strand:- start:1444 stop:2493 length:1050 start_codon:yes stop_codon:yes gene_type:complete
LKAIVTGGAGFIGSALVKKLIKSLKCEVMVIDSLTYASQMPSLQEVLENKLFSFSETDICDTKSLMEIYAIFQPDFVFNLAAETHVDRSIDSPELFLKTNVIGTYSLLDVSLKFWRDLDATSKKKFRFLHISTDEVFGDLKENEPPFKETNNYHPSSPYSASKASSDHLVRAWYKTYNLPVLLSNCSNNYGPFQFYEKLIPLMIIKALRGEKLPIYGTGMQVRDWLYVEDHADALIKIIQEGKVGESYNIGASCEKTNLQVVKEICRILDEIKPSKPGNITSYKELISFVDDRPGHDLRYAINSDKIKKELNWKASEDFESGLRKTVEWYLEKVDSISYEANRIGINRN